MVVENNRLVLEDEVSDVMLDEVIEIINKEEIDTIEINTDNISSLVLQQLFCVSKQKRIVCNDPFIAKFFDNIKFEK